MAVLVTGGAGYIGSHIVLELIDAGERVIVIDDLSTGSRSAVPNNIPLYIDCFSNERLVEDVIANHGVDTIIHLAAKTDVGASLFDPITCYRKNTAYMLALLKVALQTGVKHLLLSSTAAVYGQPKSNPVTEDATTSPVSPYGRSKLACEWMLQDAARVSKLRYVILRYFNVAGADPLGRAGQTSGTQHLIKIAVQTALGLRENIEIFGTDHPTPDGTCIRDYIQVTDLARAHLSALDYLRNGGENEILNCGTSRGASVLQVLNLVRHISGASVPIIRASPRAGDPIVAFASNDLITRRLGWQPRYDLHDTVSQALSWERRIKIR